MPRLNLLFVLLFFFTASNAAPLYPVPSGKKFGFINDAGLLLIPPVFDELGPLADGMWPVLQGKKWGFVSEATQSVAVVPRFEDAAKFSDGLCAVI